MKSTSATPDSTHALNGRAAPTRQRGAVLIVGLVMLTVVTMLVVSMMKTSMLDLKIGGVSQDALVNFNNAEIGLGTYFINNRLGLSNNCLTASVNTCNNVTSPVLTGGNNVTLTATQTYCSDKPGFTGNQIGTSFQTVVLDVMAAAHTLLGNDTRLHQGFAQDLPPGACSI